MSRNHEPLAQLRGGPLDGATVQVDLLFGMLPDGLVDLDDAPDCPMPQDRCYKLIKPVMHRDGTLCGGRYEWGPM